MRGCLGLYAAAGVILLAGTIIGPAAAGEATQLKPALAPLGFLVGSWGAGTGRAADTRANLRGTSTFTVEAGGGVLLRRDHTELFDAKGRPSGGFDQIMIIYAEGGTLSADYSDGDHVIHYTQAQVVSGHSVAFLSGGPPVAPRFKLVYDLKAADDLGVSFEIEPPAETTFRPIAVGELHRQK